MPKKVARVLGTQFGLSVTAGGLVHLLHRTAARRRRPTRRLRAGPPQSGGPPAPTGWRVNAVRHVWAVATPETTVYAICDGAGSPSRGGARPRLRRRAGRDGWVAYAASSMRRTRAVCLTCYAAARTARGFRTAPGAARSAVLQEPRPAGPLQRRRHQRARSGHVGPRPTRRPARPADRRAAAAGRRRALRQAPGQRIPAVFLFLCDVDRGHQLARRAGHRRAVVTRKVCGGNRTRKGATRSRCWPAWCAPPANATSACPLRSPRCCAPVIRSPPTHWHCRRPPEEGRPQRPFWRPRLAGGSPAATGAVHEATPSSVLACLGQALGLARRAGAFACVGYRLTGEVGCGRPPTCPFAAWSGDAFLASTGARKNLAANRGLRPAGPHFSPCLLTKNALIKDVQGSPAAERLVVIHVNERRERLDDVVKSLLISPELFVECGVELRHM